MVTQPHGHTWSSDSLCTLPTEGPRGMLLPQETGSCIELHHIVLVALAAPRPSALWSEAFHSIPSLCRLMNMAIMTKSVGA